MENGLMRRSALPALSRDKKLSLFDSMFDDILSAFPFDDAFIAPSMMPNSNSTYPKVNIVEGKDGTTIEAAVPGLSREQINLEVKDNMLILSGESNTSDDNETSKVVRREIKRSSFRRSFYLYDHVDVDNITAVHENGVLKIFLPKAEVVEPDVKKIEIK